MCQNHFCTNDCAKHRGFTSASAQEERTDRCWEFPFFDLIWKKKQSHYCKVCFKVFEMGLHEVHSEKRKGAHSKGSDKKACGDRHPHLLPLSVGLTLIHWSHDHELLAWSRPGALWSICRMALLIVGIPSMHTVLCSLPHKNPNFIVISELCSQGLFQDSCLYLSCLFFYSPFTSFLSESVILFLCLSLNPSSCHCGESVGGVWRSNLADTEWRDKAPGYYLGDTREARTPQKPSPNKDI